jgi:hypothetical protein
MMELKTSDHGFKTLVVDSGTELQKVYLDSITKGKDMPSLNDYGKLRNETRKSIRFLRDLPMNLIYITLSQDEKDEEFGGIIRKPSLTGKMPEEFCGYMNIVLYLGVKEVDGDLKRYCITQPTERIYAKDHTWKLDRFEVPDFAVIYNKVFGHVASATDKPAPAKAAKGKGGKEE